jgi:sugar phosphate isomerase/epimerase
MLKLSIASDAISHDFETAVLLGLEWGLEYFELKRVHDRRRVAEATAEDLKKVQGVLRKNTVRISSLSPGLFKASLAQENIQQELKRFEKTVAIAHELQVNRIIIFGFTRTPDLNSAEAMRQIEDTLGQVAQRAQSEGLTLFLENDRGLWVNTPEELKQVMTGVNSPALKINWDPCNLIAVYPNPPFSYGYDLVKDWVGHVHIKDAKAKGPDQFEHAMVGAGDMDWIGQFEALAKAQFDGFCVLEPHFGSRVSSSREHLLATRHLMRQAQVRLSSHI